MTAPTKPTADPKRVALGPTLLEGGARFAVRARLAHAVEVCLLDGDGERRVALEPVGEGVFAAEIEGVGPGDRYGLRVHGPYDPSLGRWCDPTKLLLDPRARAFEGRVSPVRAALLAGSGVDTRAYVPASLVVADEFEWADHDRPHHPWADTVIYEVHVKGATMRHRGVPAALRGTYLGLSRPVFVRHLVELGVTTVELLPVHELVDEAFLVDAGMTNYWGYNPIGPFAPAARYAASRTPGSQVAEFKTMVEGLHRGGLEVILDVVFNHTAEGDETGPTLSLRGIDAPAHYRHDAAHRLVDTTGCGNSINAAADDAIELVLDSLRYWAARCHVDGFRFDLAPTLARPDGAFDPRAPFLERCAADPVLAGCKLICEPWDIGSEDSYALGRFPAPYREWNGRFRDVAREFWRGADGQLGALASGLAGSADLVGERGVTASINYVASHDGFTLRDLVSYERKHNEANLEENEDGSDDNRSWNCGVEGDTDDPSITALRHRQARALLATALLARGVPMVLGGDELWRTQQGNNNAYCQDNEVSWLDWDGADQEMRAFVTRALALRRETAALRETADDAPIAWLREDGAAMARQDWEDPAARRLAMVATSGASTACVLVNGAPEPARFTLPASPAGYVERLSSAVPSRHGARHAAGDAVEVEGRSVLVLVAAPSPPPAE